MTKKNSTQSLISVLRIIPDPRIDRCKKHSLESILFISLVGMLCGADSFSEIEELAQVNQEWIEGYIDLPNGIPSHDTLCRVFSLIDKDRFCKFFVDWTQALTKGKIEKVIAIDGKSLCGSIGDGLKGMAHILHAWSVENGLCIGQQPVRDKSNEITAMRPLLELLDLKGCTVTADAIHSHKETATLIVEKGGDYVLPIKDNQKDLKEEIECIFMYAFKKDFKGIDSDEYETLEKEHGRIEQRRYWLIAADELPSAKEWSGIKTVGLCERERTLKGKTSTERVFFISSLGIDAQGFAKVARSHWLVENGLHWVLDVSFREDHMRYRNKVMAQNMSCLRKMVLNILKHDHRKASLRAKRLRAACSQAYRDELLSCL